MCLRCGRARGDNKHLPELLGFGGVAWGLFTGHERNNGMAVVHCVGGGFIFAGFKERDTGIPL